MLRIRDIMTTTVVAVTPETTVREAFELFTESHVSGAPVLAGTRVVGVISLTDLAEFAASQRETPPGRREIQDEELDVPFDSPDDDDEPSSAFFVDLWEDGGAEVGTRFDEPDAPEWNALADQTVGDVMTRAIRALPPDASVERAAGVMREAGIHRLLVMQGDALLGIVTTTDIANAVARHELTATAYVFGAPSHLDRRA